MTLFNAIAAICFPPPLPCLDYEMIREPVLAVCRLLINATDGDNTYCAPMCDMHGPLVSATMCSICNV